MKKAAIIQARMGSTRLPGKVLMQIEDKPLIGHIISRVQQSAYVDDIILATTTDSADDQLVAYAQEIGVKVYRGETANVLSRYYNAAKENNVDVIIRVTADDPFKDPVVIDKLIEAYVAGDYDYVSNTIEPSYPEGLDIEVFSFSALEKCFKQAQEDFEKEHVTPYIWMHPEKFKLLNVKNDKDLSDIRLTVDTAEDIVFAKEIYKNLYHKKKMFRLNDVLDLFEHKPELLSMMPRIVRNQGLIKSMGNKKVE